MKSLVLFDSVFGNTEKIAQAIGTGLETGSEVTVRKITDTNAAELSEMDLVVVGSPTRGFRPTKPVADFLQVLPTRLLRGKKVAAFDTRMSQQEIDSSVFFLKYLVKAFGYAAKPISAGLLRAGGVQPYQPEGFLVHGQEGPLFDGELERATEWGKKLLE